MRLSHALSAALAFGVLTVAAKGIALSGPIPAEDIPAYLRTLAERLGQSGFSARIDKRGFVEARRGDCRIKARDLNPIGVMRLSYERLGAAYGPTRYAWRGAWYADPPRYVPLASHYTQRELARIGIETPRGSITAVAGSAACATLSAQLFDIPIVQR